MDYALYLIFRNMFFQYPSNTTGNVYGLHSQVSALFFEITFTNLYLI